MSAYLHSLGRWCARRAPRVLAAWLLLIAILGGGVSARLYKFAPMLTLRAPVVAASFLNSAGIVGAALMAETNLLSGADA